MKKDIFIVIPIILILLCFYPGLIALAGDCGEAIIATLSGNHKLNPAMHSTCSGAKPVIFSTNDFVVRNSYIEIWVDSGGKAHPPYNWEINGTGFYFNGISGPTTATTSADLIRLQLWADATACGSAIITVEDSCHQTSESSVREPNNGHWVLVENITCGTLDNMPGAGTCHSNYYCIEGGYRYLDSWVAGTNMSIRWHPMGDCTKYPCTPYDRNYCYDPGYYPKFYHVGIHYKQKWRWDCLK